MSPRGSTAPDETDAARAAADRARGAEPHRSDPALAAVRSARVGKPALVRTPDGARAYWLAPFVKGKLACGFARVELDGRVSQLGEFGAGADDRGAWPAASYFAAPPRKSLDEIKQSHPDAAVAAAVLTYDRSPAHWGWRVDLGAGDAAFIGPSNWYVRPAN